MDGVRNTLSFRTKRDTHTIAIKLADVADLPASIWYALDGAYRASIDSIVNAGCVLGPIALESPLQKRMLSRRSGAVS